MTDRAADCESGNLPSSLRPVIHFLINLHILQQPFPHVFCNRYADRKSVGAGCTSLLLLTYSTRFRSTLKTLLTVFMEIVIVLFASKSYTIYSHFQNPILHRSFRGHLSAGRDPALSIETGSEISTELFHGGQWKKHEKMLNFLSDIPELLIQRYLLAKTASSIPITRDFPKGRVPGSLLISLLWYHQLQGEAVL